MMHNSCNSADTSCCQTSTSPVRKACCSQSFTYRCWWPRFSHRPLLGAAGVGELTIVDDDQIDSSNLQRQIAHGHADIGSNKASSAAESVLALNPSTVCHAINRRLDADALETQIAAADIVIDATDNAETRFLLNRICWQQRTALVSGAAVRWEGHISVFDANQPDSPCYQCLYPNTELDDQLNCAESGVISPLVGVIGSMQALEAIKCLTGIGEALVGTVLFFRCQIC